MDMTVRETKKKIKETGYEIWCRVFLGDLETEENYKDLDRTDLDNEDNEDNEVDEEEGEGEEEGEEYDNDEGSLFLCQKGAAMKILRGMQNKDKIEVEVDKRNQRIILG